MKLWDKGTSLNKLIENFTIGKDREIDLLLASFDVLGSIAHAKMLNDIGLLEDRELSSLEKELKRIYIEDIAKGNFTIEEGVEDVHSQVELMLTRALGNVGKKIHSGRSRNDQVMVDLKMFMREELFQIAKLVAALFETLQKLSEQHKDVLMPGYTHTQIAMPSSFGLWFGAYAESLSDDTHLLSAAFKIVNQNPLGSAAGYGSSFPLNRQMTSDLLGFESLNYNVVYAQMGRGKTEKSVSFAISSLATTLSKLATDVCAFNSQNFGFIKFPDELTTGSSIMPHKKNPDVFELLRSKANKLQALPIEISLITNNLISGYHRDLQTIKESFIPAFEELKLCLQVAEYAIAQIKVNEAILNEDKYKYLFTVETVNEKVLSGTPFRDAYKEVGQTVESGNYEFNSELHHTHEGSIGNLMNDEIKRKMESAMSPILDSAFQNALETLIK
ncbi:MAG: argininosuccinate lyase [Bacteroidota bacterium]